MVATKDIMQKLRMSIIGLRRKPREQREWHRMRNGWSWAGIHDFQNNKILE